MQNSSLVDQYENFRSSMVAGINSLEIDESQKQIFMMSLQSFYLQMLHQIPNQQAQISANIIHPEIIN